MIWVVLWALGVIGFLAFVFRGHLRWFVAWVLGLVALVASAFLQAALAEHRRYRELVEAASRVGWVILLAAVTVLLADIAIIAVYTVRQGRSAHRRGTVVTEQRPFMTLGSRLGRSRLRVLYGKRGRITAESLVDGTATFGERVMVLGMATAFVSFLFVWVGSGLILMKGLAICVLIPILPGVFVYNALRTGWKDFRKAKRRLAAREPVRAAD